MWKFHRPAFPQQDSRNRPVGSFLSFLPVGYLPFRHINIMLDLFCNEDSTEIEMPSSFDQHVFDLSFGGASNSYSRRKADFILSDPNSDGPMPLSKKTGNELITEALNQLSLEERGRVENELHGVDFDKSKELEANESPAYQNEQLEQMERELQRLKAASSWSLQLAGIEMAERQNMAYVKNRAFRVTFLRCEHWNPAKAASRFIRFFDWKLELFGESKLTKDIGIADLEPEDVKMLKRGHMQRLPERDRAGRAIVISVFNRQTYHSPESLVGETEKFAVDSLVRRKRLTPIF